VKREEFKTVKNLMDWYMTLPSVQEKQSYKRKLISISRVIDYFGKMPVGSVEGDTQEKYRQMRELQGAASGTIDLEIALLSAAYHLALKWKKISAESMPGEFLIRFEKNPRRLVKDEEYKTLLQKAKDDFRDVLICGYESAMRSSEIANLRAGQIHLDEIRLSNGKKMTVDYIDLGQFDTKNKTRRTVPVSQELKAVLERRIKDQEPQERVFMNGPIPWTVFAVAKAFERLCNAVGVIHGDKAKNERGERIGVVFHCLRHTRISKWVEAGFSDEIIRRASGHMSLDAYRAYVKLDPSAVMRLVESSISGKSGIKPAQVPEKVTVSN
jgi:integrase